MYHKTLAEAQRQLDDIVECIVVDGERIILTRNGTEVAAIVHIDDARWLQEIEDRHDREAIQAARADIEENGTVPWEQVKAELGL